MEQSPTLRSQPMSYTGGNHTVFHHRYHIVWITKVRYKVLEGALRERIRTVVRQVCKEPGVQIVSGVLSRERVHMLGEIPPHIPGSDFVRRGKEQSRIGCRWGFPDLPMRYWGRHFWARFPSRAATSRTMSYFSTFGSTSLPASAGGYSVFIVN
ncbi:MAG: IS200/IS605 family transposase [Methylocella sp.]